MSGSGISRAILNGAAFSAGFALILASLSAVNLRADPYADLFFLTHWRAPRVRTLDQFTDLRFKVALLGKAGERGVDAAIFGSSRAMRIDPSDPMLTAMFPHTLNLAVQGARLGMTRQFVEMFSGRNPGAEALVGIDFFSFAEGPIDRSIFLDQTHPLPALRESFWRLASSRTVQPAWEILQGVPVQNELRLDGLAVRPHPKLANVQTQMDRFVAEGWKQWQHFRNFRYDRSKLDLVREIRHRAPSALFFIPPVSRAFQEGQHRAGLDAQYHEWLQDLAVLGGVIDFTDAAAIVDQPRLYLDMHHTDSEAGAMMISDLAAYLRHEPLKYGRVLGEPAPTRP